jgi:ATP-binding cassette subfamily B protein
MDANIRSVFYYSIFFPIVEVLVAFAFAIIIGYGTILLFNSEIQLGSITAFIMFVNLFFRPIRAIADRFNNIQMGVVAAERIFNLIDNKDNVEVETQLNKPASFNREALRSSSPDFSSPENKITPNNLLGKIEFRNVHFRYNEGSWILNNLSFTVQPGESLALVGKTGSGKTSIASLITQLYQHEKGEILIDDLPITEYFLPALRKRIAFVLQDVFLFSGSIQNNLTLNDENLPLDNLIEISKQIGAFEFINALPGGFQYNVQERGMSLSTGQRQLISFIRALAANPDVIILDEATSSVDTQTEQMIQKAIELLLNNRTAIVIAHRLSTIRHCNTIMVLNQGEILERGSHETLMNQNGYYKELVNKHHTVEE